MRRAAVETLIELAAADPRVVLVTADLGWGIVEPFAARFPDRFVNVGVAEQNMLAVATGLAEAGLVPFAYSIAPFAALRPYEFIRNGPVLQRLPVRILGVGGGFDYGAAGTSHHALDDLGALGVQPELVVLAPADAAQARAALLASWQLPGPVYVRLGRDEDARVPGLAARFRLGHIEQLMEGRDVAIVATGVAAIEAVAAAEALAATGVSVSAFVAAGLQPAPVGDLAAVLRQHRLVATVELHYRRGGLGSLVAEIAAERPGSGSVLRLGVERVGAHGIGSPAFLQRAHGLDREAIVGAVRAALGAGRPQPSNPHTLGITSTEISHSSRLSGRPTRRKSEKR